MKRLSISVKAIVVATMACAAGLATAAGSTNLAVSATVNGVCKFSATSQPLAFGAIDPSLTSNVTTTAAVKYKCTNKTSSGGITGIAGPHNMTTTASDLLAYTLTIAGDTGAGTGFGTNGDLTATVTGTITALQYQGAVAGSYTDTVVLNITP